MAEYRTYLVKMIEIAGSFGLAMGGRCGAFTHAVVPATDPRAARELANARLSQLGFTVISDGEEVVDITGWVDLDESIQTAVQRMVESVEVEFGDFETFPLDDIEGDIECIMGRRRDA